MQSGRTDDAGVAFMHDQPPGSASVPSTQHTGGLIPCSNGKRKATDGTLMTLSSTQTDDTLPKRSKKGGVRKGPGGRRGGGSGRNNGLPRDAAFPLLAPLPKDTEAPLEGLRPVRLSKVDKAPFVTISDDRLSATSCKGYRMARATHGAHEGTWYYEITIARLGPTGHSRVGWATARAEISAPVGFDKRSFGFRDLEGSKVHDSWREAYGKPYGEGDVIGCWLHMPAGGRPFAYSPADVRNYRSHLFPVAESPTAPQPEVLQGSAVAFTRNGALQGIAYRDIPEGTYLPAISLFTDLSQTEGARVTCNFGPKFVHAPPIIDSFPQARPVCELSMPQDPSSGSSPTATGFKAAVPSNHMRGARDGAAAIREISCSGPEKSAPAADVAHHMADVASVQSALICKQGHLPSRDSMETNTQV